MPVFWCFLLIQGHRFLEKWPTSFLRDTGLKFVVDCTNGVANEFQGVLSCFKRKKFFLKIGNFLTPFAYPGSQISWKIANYFFEKYRPEIWCGLHKWCCERILKHFGLLRAKKKIFEGSQFFTFFAYLGSQISWKMTNYSFERYRPEICRGLHKWCCERIWRRFRLFRAKKFFFQKLAIFLLFLHIRGHRFLEKWPTSFLRDTGLKFVVDCTNGVANEFQGVLGCFKRKFFFWKLAIFWLLLHIRGHRFLEK